VRRTFLRTPWGGVTAALYVSCVAFVAWVLRRPDARSALVQWVDLAAGTACILVYLTAALLLARSASGRLRTAWLLLAAGQATTEAADTVYAALGYPSVSAADVLYLASYPLAVAGVLMLPFVVVTRRDRLLLLLDRALVLAAGGTFIWYAVAPTLERWQSLTLEARVNLVYPPLQLVLLALAVTLIQRDVNGVHRVTLAFLALAFGGFVISSLLDLHSIVQGGGRLEVVWLAVSLLSYTVAATGPAWQIAVGQQQEEGPRISAARLLLRSALPYLAAAVSVLVLALAVGRGASPAQIAGVLAGTAATTAMLLYRQHVVLRENVRLYEELDEARVRLEGQNETLREHVKLQADVERISRHDLKTPLSSIIAIPQMLRETSSLTHQQDELIQMVELAGHRLLGMINLSLDLFRMEQGDYRFEPAAVDMAEVARRVAFDLRALAASLRVGLRVDPPPGEPIRAWAEELLSYSMIANLVKNALEASPEGGTVTVSFQQDGGDVWIRIHNQGAVPEEIRDRFFEKYATAGKAEGTGLGTYSARLMAETQRGRIGMVTGAAGTTVEVVLRAPPDPARRA
jgi:signal transduction histidine kinase